MKQLLLTYGLKLLIWLLEKAVEKISVKKTNGTTTTSDSNGEDAVVSDDIVINPDTAKKFAEFIKNHTKKEN